MSKNHQARFYLHETLRQRAVRGEHSFINKISEVLQSAGFRVSFDVPENALPRKEEYSLFFMREPFARNSVSFRRAYYYPFWHIERTNERWYWDVANTHFDPAKIDEAEARKFFHTWRKRLYGPLLGKVEKGGFIYVPLQGRLLEQRSFQTCSPVQMIEHVVEQNSGTKVVATLHPGEEYSLDERTRLDQLVEKHAQLSVQLGGMESLLPCCDCVVTMNSSVAFAGYLFKKPAVLFGRIDFHHIAANVETLGVQGAFEKVRDMRPPYPQYLWWFLQHMSINAGRSDAQDHIRARLAEFGWPVS
ncbi:hypothetical protein J7400_01430 [Shimia sp. R9_2]|uniref:hypothetical protein n=1 Tax=Shimia sp. R9_2 TaxID=2821112 RepID=UPI001ADC21B9|nr:hypothetical protein [Shimia sp. R9_2]MBO9395323.1 hypothetical protein [Shimia sp. R9_2]